MSEKCSHNKSFNEECYDCEIVLLNETINNLSPIVEKAKLRLKIINSILIREKANDISQNRLKELIAYNSETGVFTWKFRNQSEFKDGKNYKSWNTNFAGKDTGKKDGNGYLNIFIFRKRYHSHRLAWLYEHGEMPLLDIDHINGIRTDNRIKNLRMVGAEINNKNKRMYKNNKSGCNGVNLYKKTNRWESSIKVNGKKITLGYFNDIVDAINARKEAEKKYGFHENHGRSIAVTPTTEAPIVEPLA